MTPFQTQYPLRVVAQKDGGFMAGIVSIVTTLITAGVLGAGTGEWILALLGLIPGALTGIATLIGAFYAAKHGEKYVTPVLDPRDMYMVRLKTAAQWRSDNTAMREAAVKEQLRQQNEKSRD